MHRERFIEALLKREEMVKYYKMRFLKEDVLKQYRNLTSSCRVKWRFLSVTGITNRTLFV
jgi:hypothetical protein